jgi:ectoine hydroxylase
MIPLGKPGALTEWERYMFDVFGYLVIPDALTPQEVSDCLDAAKRLHAPFPQDKWRQIGAAYESEPAIEPLIDHPSMLPKVRGLLGDYFILQSSWCTKSPSGFTGQNWHQDGSGLYEFRRLALPTPLVQLRVGYFLTDQTRTDMGNMIMIPGSHNAALPKPVGPPNEDIPISSVICGKPGTALMFHQGVFHCGTRNSMDYPRYIQHMVYSPPWLIASDRKGNDQEFMKRTTPLRRSLMGEWERPDQPFAGGYPKPPFPE